MLTLTNRIDMRPGAVPLVIHLGQYDSDFSLVFELYSSAGNFTVESGTTAMIRGTKTDGNAYDADATIDVSAKTVTVAGSEQMTAAKGRNVYELVLTKDEKVLSTANFILDVERAAMDADTIASESVLKELNAIIDSAATSTQAAANAASAADRAEDAADSVSSASTQIATNTADIADLKADLSEYESIFTADVSESIDNWLDAHPEATTTVQDNSLTTAKYQNDSVTDDKLSNTGVKLTKVGYNVFPQYRIAPTHVIDLPSITGYYPQGFAFDGTYYYVGYLDVATYHSGIIVKYDTNGNEIARSTDTYNHVNSIEIIGDQLYVASLGDIFVANKSTLAKESTISCRGGSGFVANVQFSGSYGGVPGNQSLQYVNLTSSKGMEVYYSGKKVDCIAVPSSPLTPQGGTGYNGYIYAVESVGSDIGTNGIVNVWDVQGNTCAQISIELVGGELEDVSIVDNNMYMLNSLNNVPSIYSASISMLTPYLPVLNWYNCKGQRYQCDLTYSNSTQLTKITVPPIVDIFLAYAQPCQFDVITNAFFAKAGYNSAGFEITYFENNVAPASFIRLHYTRTGAQTYEMDSCSIVSLLDGTTTSAWVNAFPKIDALFITTEFLTR